MIQNFINTETEAIDNVVLTRDVLVLVFLFASIYFSLKIILMKLMKHTEFYKWSFGDLDETSKTAFSCMQLAFSAPTTTVLFLTDNLAIKSVFKYEAFAKDFLVYAIASSIILLLILCYLIYCLCVYLHSLKQKITPNYHYNVAMLIVCPISFLLMLATIFLCKF